MNYPAASAEPVGGAKSSLSAGYKDVMVHLDGTHEDEIRLAHAEMIATLFGAHLTGLYTNMLPDVVLYPGEAGAVAIAELDRQTRDDGETTLRRLARRFIRRGVENEVRMIEDRPGLLVQNAVATEAR